MKRFLSIFCCMMLAMVWLPLGAVGAEPSRVIYLSDLGNDSSSGTSPAKAVKTFNRAVRLLYDGGTIVLCGDVTVSGALWMPENAGRITVTTKYGDKDYSEKASLVMKANISLNGPFVFRDLTVKTGAKNLVFICNGNRVIFDDGIVCKATSSSYTLPSITGGYATNYAGRGALLTVKSGSWLRLRGGNRSTGTVNGATVIEITGGTYTSLFEGGGASAGEGNISILISGGDFQTVCGATGNAVNGSVAIAVTGGTVKSVSTTSGGKVSGSATVAIGAGAKVTSAIGSTALVDGDCVLCAAAKRAASSFDRVDIVENPTAAIEASVRAALDAADSEIDRASSGWYSAFAKAENGSLRFGEKEEGTSGIELLSVVTESTRPSAKLFVLIAVAVLLVAALVLLLVFRPKGTAALSLLLASAAVLSLLTACGGDAAVTTDPAATEEPTVPTGEEFRVFGNATLDGKTVSLSDGFIVTKDTVANNARIDFSVKLSEDATFSCFAPVKVGENADALTLTGYYFVADAKNDTLTLWYLTDGARALVASRGCTVDAGQEYPVCIALDGASREIAFYFNDNPLDTDPYPKFTQKLRASFEGVFGVGCTEGRVEVSSLLIGTKTDTAALSKVTYTNPIVTNMTDPEMFFYDGTYYLYGTRTTDNKNLYCYTSTDGVHFKDAGCVMKGTDVWGESVFKAANILYHDGWFYMFYMANPASGDAVTSYAVSKSPLGPFTNDVKEPLSKVEQIGGQPFVDEDGRIYLVLVRYNPGNAVWLVEITCENGKVTVLEDTATKLLEATEKWENALAACVECGYLVKHNGIYYLLYAGGNYNSTYGMGYATSTDIKGPYVRYENNPILKSNDQRYGVGAASVFPSPDGSEYFITYLSHTSALEVRPLCTNIDRIKFVPTASGIDRIEVYGPTGTAQPAPSSDGDGTPSEVARFRMN